LLLSAFILLPGPSGARTGTTVGADPTINEPFLAGEYQRWKGVFERPGREVYDFRHEILATVAPRPGMDVADIGAGTGLFTRLFATAVGSTGQVFAVDISQELVRGIEREVFAEEIRQTGFVLERESDLMRQNYLLIFRKPGSASNDRRGVQMAENEVLYEADDHALPWRLITDGVMGGLSSGTLRTARIADRACLRLRGQVRLDNNGGFVQMASDLNGGAPLDASAYRGLAIDVHGNGQGYKLHLRTDATTLPWQSYRADFTAGPQWERLHIPFADFRPHRLDAPLDTRRLRRLGLVAIGRAFEADLCLARLALYR